MSDLIAIVLSALVVNNFVLVQFLGLCPFFGTTGSPRSAWAMALATAFVLTFSAVLCFAIERLLLAPLGLEYLRILVFIVVIATTVQATELYLRHTSPLLHQVLGIYLPLITTNCAVLALTLLVVANDYTLVQTVAFAIGAAGGFALVVTLFAALRQRLESADVPAPFAGLPVLLLTAGIMALALSGFTGIVSS